MKQLTVRGVEEALHEALRREAQKRGVSVNKLVLSLLKDALDLEGPSSSQEQAYDDLDHLAGTWTEEDTNIFNRSLREQRKVDGNLW